MTFLFCFQSKNGNITNSLCEAEMKEVLFLGQTFYKIIIICLPLCDGETHT